MPPKLTEALPDHAPVDTLPLESALQLMLDGQQAAIAAVSDAVPQLARAVEIMADAITAGGALVYIAAGSSGLMALSDCSELAGTFGIPTSQTRIHMAGGVPADGIMPGHTEDATTDEILITARDVAIILSASGSTPYAVAAARHARTAGARVIAIANNPGTPLLADADVAICLATPPEIIAGSTRLGAGTAQKAALNAMSTMMGVRLGHVYQGMMVNVVADNAKLRRRAAGMVARIAQVSEAAAQSALSAADGQVKPAILIAKGHSAATARALLDQNKGHLGPCLTTP